MKSTLNPSAKPFFPRVKLNPNAKEFFPAKINRQSSSADASIQSENLNNDDLSLCLPGGRLLQEIVCSIPKKSPRLQGIYYKPSIWRDPEI